MKRILAAVTTLLAVVTVVVLVRTVRLAPTPAPTEAMSLPAVDAEAAAGRLARALRFETITTQGGGPAPASLAGLHRYLEETFPRTHQTLTREVVGGGSLLYTWAGQDPKLGPLILMSHLDVVPVEAGTEGLWTHPPFAGVVADGFVWGRGAMDDKMGVMAILEAIEALLAEGVAPRRAVCLAFGHDEEAGAAGGENGAAQMASLLRSRGVVPDLVLDEGGAVLQGMVPGLDRPLAVVGIAEKGYLSLELSVKSEGGHSSTPPAQTAIGILSRALSRLEDRPLPARIEGPARQMIEALAPEMPFAQRLAMSNLWLSSPLVKWMMLGTPASAATLRTTTAATVIRGGDKENLLPQQASGVVNFRILPGDSTTQVMEHVRATIDDSRIQVRPTAPGVEPSAVSATDSPAYRSIAETIRQIHPRAVVVPNLVVGATDARFYASMSRSVYRFTPLVAQQADLKRVHGTDERVSVANYADMVRFYGALVRRAAVR